MESEITESKEEKPSRLDSMIMEHNNNALKERENDESFNKTDADVINEIKYNKTVDKDNVQDALSVESVHNEVLELKNLLNKVIENKSNLIEEADLINNVKNNELNETVEEKLIKKFEDTLDELDIDEEFFEEIIKVAKNYSDEELEAKEILREIFEREILVTTGNFKGEVALVGPTGVGKTTTIAKLAGRLALVEKKKVGLITIDTFRIGAIEQFKTYAEIMNIPFKVVITI